jgi:hypothetical protein
MKDELYRLLRNNKQYDTLKYITYEILFEDLFEEMNDHEKRLHGAIRDLTQNLMIQLSHPSYERLYPYTSSSFLTFLSLKTSSAQYCIENAAI